MLWGAKIYNFRLPKILALPKISGSGGWGQNCVRSMEVAPIAGCCSLSGRILKIMNFSGLRDIHDGARWGSALRAGVKVLLGISLTVDGQTMVLTIGIPTIGPFRSAHVRKLI